MKNNVQRNKKQSLVACSENNQTSKMEHFSKMEPLSIFAKSLVLDILLSSECASAYSSFGRNTVQVPEKNWLL